MGKIKKFSGFSMKTITGGKDPLRLIEEFLIRQGFDPRKTKKIEESDIIQWVVEIEAERELEILLENMHQPNHTTIYLGVNIAVVPLRGANDMLAAALEIADGLVGTKISLVGHFLVLSSSMGGAGLSVEDLEYQFKLITAQVDWFRTALLEELEWEDFAE